MSSACDLFFHTLDPSQILSSHVTMNTAPWTEEQSEDGTTSTLLPTSLDFDKSTEEKHVDPCCGQCGAPFASNGSLVCQQCGWYESIGSYVEIDRSWEVATDPQLANQADIQAALSAKLPTWTWVLASCVVGVIIESVTVRIFTSDGGGLRPLWSLAQLFIGLFAFAICHTYCFLQVMKNEADTKMLDYLLRPIQSWSILFRDMPKRAGICYVGLSGLTAVMMSLLVIGSLPYDRLLDWNIEKKEKSNLMGKIMDQAQGNAQDDNKDLAEAIGDFSGQAELEDNKKNKAAKKERQKKNCVIIGYRSNRPGEIQTLFLATKHNAKLRYAGNVRVTGLSADDLQTLTKKLAASRSRRQYVKISIDGATWVKPKQLCRVSYKRQGKQGGLYGTRLEDLLGEK